MRGFELDLTLAQVLSSLLADLVVMRVLVSLEPGVRGRHLERKLFEILEASFQRHFLGEVSCKAVEEQVDELPDLLRLELFAMILRRDELDIVAKCDFSVASCDHLRYFNVIFLFNINLSINSIILCL